MRSRDNTEGAIPQAMMEQHPSAKGIYSYTFPLRGIIKTVYLKDDEANNSGETVVDIMLLDGYPAVYKVPLAYPYINADEGEEWTPKEGNIAIVQFIAGNKNIPIVTGFITPRQQNMTATMAEAPRNHKKRNGTSETIDKDGNRTVYVKGNETLTIAGTGNVVVQETLNVQIMGDANISVDGNTTLTSPLTTVNGDIQLNGNLIASENVIVGGALTTSSIAATGGLTIVAPGAVVITGLSVGVIETGA
jgi:phage baseplate assembly protein gpV